MADIYLSIFAIGITLLSFFKMIKTIFFRDIIILYVLVNFPVIFILDDQRMLYFVAFIMTVLLSLSIRKFINYTYHTDSYIGLEGIVLVLPRLSLLVRLNLLMIGNFPPFLNFGIVFNHMINDGFSLKALYLIMVVMFNFLLFSKLTNRFLFGKPNRNIVYTDLSLKHTIFMGLLSLFNLIYGVYYLLNL